MSQYGQGVNPYGSGASEPMTPYSSSDRSSSSGGAPALPAASPSSISRSSSSSSQPEQSQEPEVGPPCLSVAILRWNRDTKEPVLFGGKVNLENFSKMQQGGLRQFLKMISRAVVKNAKPEVRHMVEIKEYGRYRCFYYLRSSGLAAVMVTQSSYKVRVAFAVIEDLLNRFEQHYPDPNHWRKCVKDMSCPCGKFANDVFARAQTPSQYDKLSLAQERFDSVKVQMHKTLESVLARGESLEDLVKRSEDLSVTTKFFYKDAKKLNKCPCVVM